MKLPWDKLEFKKVDPDKAYGGTVPSPLVLDEIGQISSLQKEVSYWGGAQKAIDTTPLQLEYEIKSYPDGSKYVVVNKITQNLTFKLNSYEDLWILNQIHDVVKSAERNVEVTIPFLIDSQADRRFDTNQPHGLKLVCNFLNGLTNFRYRIFHPHNAEVVEALLDRVEIVDNSKFIKKVLQEIPTFKEGVDGKFDNLILMSSDAGGFKPLMKLADKIGWNGETYSASKSRKYEDGKSKLIQQVDRQDFGGKDILIIDDLMVGGKTFLGLYDLLKERNVGKIYLAVSHITVENLGTDAVTNYFDKVFTTNSKFDKYWDNTDRGFSIEKNLKIISLF